MRKSSKWCISTKGSPREIIASHTNETYIIIWMDWVSEEIESFHETHCKSGPWIQGATFSTIFMFEVAVRVQQNTICHIKSMLWFESYLLILQYFLNNIFKVYLI